ncbi:calcium-activated BK potassium channel [Pelomyxa schiedti]|nr:calcium-activated BK potassium channel [Pelomyxa schiedti]
MPPRLHKAPANAGSGNDMGYAGDVDALRRMTPADVASLYWVLHELACQNMQALLSLDSLSERQSPFMNTLKPTMLTSIPGTLSQSNGPGGNDSMENTMGEPSETDRFVVLNKLLDEVPSFLRAIERDGSVLTRAVQWRIQEKQAEKNLGAQQLSTLTGGCSLMSINTLFDFYEVQQLIRQLTQTQILRLTHHAIPPSVSTHPLSRAFMKCMRDTLTTIVDQYTLEQCHNALTTVSPLAQRSTMLKLIPKLPPETIPLFLEMFRLPLPELKKLKELICRLKPSQLSPLYLFLQLEGDMALSLKKSVAPDQSTPPQSPYQASSTPQLPNSTMIPPLNQDPQTTATRADEDVFVGISFPDDPIFGDFDPSMNASASNTLPHTQQNGFNNQNQEQLHPVQYASSPRPETPPSRQTRIDAQYIQGNYLQQLPSTQPTPNSQCQSLPSLPTPFTPQNFPINFSALSFPSTTTNRSSSPHLSTNLPNIPPLLPASIHLENTTNSYPPNRSFDGKPQSITVYNYIYYAFVTWSPKYSCPYYITFTNTFTTLSFSQLATLLRRANDETEEEFKIVQALFSGGSSTCTKSPVMLLGPAASSVTQNLFIEATLWRSDNDTELPTYLEGTKVVKISTGVFASFKKLKILCTTQQQGTQFCLRFTLKHFSGNELLTVKDATALSIPIEVFSHTLYLNERKEANGQPAAAVMEVLPPSGPPGIRVVVLGDNFLNTPALRVAFNDTVIIPTFHEQGTLICTVPRTDAFTNGGGAPVHVSVRVSNDGLSFCESKATFMYCS